MTFLFLDVTIELLGGESEWQGNVYVDGKPVCDDGWDINAGKVACRQLGYSGVLEIKLGECDTYFKKRNFFKPGKKHANIECGVILGTLMRPSRIKKSKRFKVTQFWFHELKKILRSHPSSPIQQFHTECSEYILLEHCLSFDIPRFSKLQYLRLKVQLTSYSQTSKTGKNGVHIRAAIRPYTYIRISCLFRVETC